MTETVEEFQNNNHAVLGPALTRLESLLNNAAFENALGELGTDTHHAILDAYKAIFWLLEPYEVQVKSYVKRQYIPHTPTTPQ